LLNVSFAGSCEQSEGRKKRRAGKKRGVKLRKSTEGDSSINQKDNVLCWETDLYFLKLGS